MQLYKLIILGMRVRSLIQIMVDDFGIDADEFGVACMVSFGYRVNEQLKKTRQSIEDITQWYN